jgi:SSS family solute:Na+ symporter
MIGTATMFTNDVFRPYLNGGKEDDKKEVLISRVTMIVVGLAGLGISLVASNIISVMMSAFALRSAGPFAAFICGLFYKNVTQRAGFVSILAGTLVAAYWIYGLNSPWGLSAMVPGGIVAFVVIFAVSMYDRSRGVPAAPEIKFDEKE